MKYICLGYYDKGKFEAMTESELIGQNPALTFGSIFEIRPAGDMSEIMKASEQRRSQHTAC